MDVSVASAVNDAVVTVDKAVGVVVISADAVDDAVVSTVDDAVVSAVDDAVGTAVFDAVDETVGDAVDDALGPVVDVVNAVNAAVDEEVDADDALAAVVVDAVVVADAAPTAVTNGDTGKEGKRTSGVDAVDGELGLFLFLRLTVLFGNGSGRRIDDDNVVEARVVVIDVMKVVVNVVTMANSSVILPLRTNNLDRRQR